MVVRKSIYALFLLALIIFKVSSAVIHISLHHDHEHDNNHKDYCELCEHALNILNEEFSIVEESQSFERVEVLVLHQQIDDYESICVAQFSNTTLFVRPPPALM